MKTVYFVRHGESTENDGSVFQGDSSVLTKLGAKQAKFLANRLRHLDFNKIISSPLERARQTAEIIGGELGREVEYEKLLIEVRRPSLLRGRPKNDPEARRIWEMIVAHKLEEDLRFSDEENFSDRKKRAAKIIEKLLGIEADKILVVAHAGIIRTLMAYMLAGEELTPAIYFGVLGFLHMDNSGISVCEYDMEKKAWRLKTWNDLAHLAE